MNDPKRLYKTPGQMLAIHEKDAKIYPYLSSSNQSDFKPDRPDRQQMCHFVYVYQEGLRSNYHQRPENLPFTRNDLQAFLDEGLRQFERGYWSVYWASDARLIGRDTIYPDGYRSVVSFRTIEFMIRPMPDYRDRSVDGFEEPKRLYIGCLDVKACLSQALRANRPGPMRTFTGMAHMNHPDRDKTRQAMVGKADITFEWRIDRVLPDKMDAIVRKWRYDQFGTAEKYHDEMKESYDQRARETLDPESQARDSAAAQPEALFQGYPPPGQPQQGPSQFPLIPVHHRGKVTSRRGKRKTSDMIAIRIRAAVTHGFTGDGVANGSWGVAAEGHGFAAESTVECRFPVGSKLTFGLRVAVRHVFTGNGAANANRRSATDDYASAAVPTVSEECQFPLEPKLAVWTFIRVFAGDEAANASRHWGADDDASTAEPSVQPHPPAPMQHVPPPGSGFARGQPGGASNPYWPQAPPTPGSYSLGTGNHSPRMTPDTWGRGSNAPSPSFPPPATAAPGGDVFRYQVPPASSPGGPSYATGPSYQRPGMAAPGGNVVPYQVPPASSDPQWYGSAGRYMHSNDPQDWDPSGYQDQYGGGSGSGRR
ncbi:hypothetical protein LA080_012739 [Diaporthe eres]|nr:hypothetical protein LA080_012739 [Diaporthe eres]